MFDAQGLAGAGLGAPYATDVIELITRGKGAMPPNLLLNDSEKTALLDYLFRRNQPPTRGGGSGAGDDPKYVFGGFGFLVDHEG